MNFNKKSFQENPKISLSTEQVNEIANLKEKISNNEYTYEEVFCECCGGERKIILSNYDRYGIFYKSNLCNDCGLIYTSPRFDQSSYINFYDSQYRKIYAKYPLIQTQKDFYEKQVNKGQKILNFIEKHHNSKKINSVLEVGCGMGGILKPFKENGCEVLGVDFGSEYIDFGKSQELSLRVGGINNINGKFDLIIYSHVFEHILNLNDELHEIKKRLKPNGVLYIEVPGIFNLKGYRYNLNRYFQNAHTFNFSLTTLNNILNNNGLELVYGNEKIESLFKSSDCSHNIVNDSQRIIKEISNLKFKTKYWALTIYGIKTLFKSFLIKSKTFILLRKIKVFFKEIKNQN